MHKYSLNQLKDHQIYFINTVSTQLLAIELKTISGCTSAKYIFSRRGFFVIYHFHKRSEKGDILTKKKCQCLQLLIIEKFVIDYFSVVY